MNFLVCNELIFTFIEILFEDVTEVILKTPIHFKTTQLIKASDFLKNFMKNIKTRRVGFDSSGKKNVALSKQHEKNQTIQGSLKQMR
ncbi:CLUMA_CG004617, isoform A [Clunio marinus]|uniref:CLUMA_CG004617, isoform A n=1 Tax=Clunio marinus TaxID=568069 RepID=A0A1J1HS64_9DIPT|nr:CLUMA_CG004617, isoform A [Clunio marinus]